MIDNIKYRNEDCTYCGSRMKIAKIRVKRPVPPGAKDLNLFDELVGWKCPGCEQTNLEGIIKCSCGSHVYSYPWNDRIPALDAYEEGVPHFQVSLARQGHIFDGKTVFFDHQCTACMSCAECAQPLNTFEFASSTTDIDENGQQWRDWWRYIYYHKSCLEKKEWW